MQGIFRLPWCSDPHAPKLSEKAAALDKYCRAPPVAEMPVPQKFKRKRTDSPEPLLPQSIAQTNKKPRSDGGPAVQSPPAHSPSFVAKPVVMVELRLETSSGSLDCSGTNARSAEPPAVCPTGSPTPSIDELASTTAEGVTMDRVQLVPADDVTSLSRVQQVIDNEFNMQILMKHNELRLIEQELAKCQIALDQLRRCEVCPFPGDGKPCESVSAGTGPALSAAPGMTRPAHPSPYGVADGPYSRHYRQWLLHDPLFDPVSPQAVAFEAESNAQLAARSTRNGGVRKSSGKSFSMSSRASDTMRSLPHYAASGLKDKNAPLVLRRSTDGQLVKLVCKDCQRGDFSSIQGFLNHCRIAHKVDYKSHDLAAIDCGRLLDVDEVASLPVETQNVPAPKPTSHKSSSSVSTPAKNLVHPMNVPGHATQALRMTKHSQNGSRKAKAVPSATKLTPIRMSSSPFKPSQQAPRLSAQFAKYKVGGDLGQAIAAATQPTDFGAEELVSSPDVMRPDSPLLPMSGSRTVAGANLPALMTELASTPARPVSRKGHRESVSSSVQRLHRPSPLATPMVSFHAHGEIPESPQDHLSNFSPHTADSAPGLVSDHEDDDHGSGSEDEAPQSSAQQMAHSLGVRRGCGGDEMAIDVAVDDDMDSHGVIIRRNSMISAEARGLRAAACGSPSRSPPSGVKN